MPDCPSSGICSVNGSWGGGIATGSSVVMVRLQAGIRRTTASRPRVRDAPELIGVLTEVPPIPPGLYTAQPPGTLGLAHLRRSGLHSPLFCRIGCRRWGTVISVAVLHGVHGRAWES